MDKKELTERLAKRFPAAQRPDAFVDELLSAIAATLAKGGRMEIRGFGSFSVHYSGPRGRPATRLGQQGPPVRFRVPHFRPGIELRTRLKELADGSMRPKPGANPPRNRQKEIAVRKLRPPPPAQLPSKLDYDPLVHARWLLEKSKRK